MAKRVTVMIDDDVAKKLRDLQAKKLRSSITSVSFSNIINEVLKKELK